MLGTSWAKGCDTAWLCSAGGLLIAPVDLPLLLRGQSVTPVVQGPPGVIVARVIEPGMVHARVMPHLTRSMSQFLVPIQCIRYSEFDTKS